MLNSFVKRFGAFLLGLMVAVSFVACGGESNDNPDTPPTDTTTTTPPDTSSRVDTVSGDTDTDVDHGDTDHGDDNGDVGAHDDNGDDNGDDVAEDTPPAPVAYSALANKTCAVGDQFYIDVKWKKGTQLGHAIKVEGGLKEVSNVKSGESTSAYHRVTFKATAAGAATIKVARVEEGKTGVNVSNKDWLKAEKFTVTVTE